MTNHVTAAMLSVFLAPMILSGAPPDANGSGVQVLVKEPDRRVDVAIGGQPFTSYIWPTTLKKPVLYPIRTAKGTLVTRGFPLDPRPGERVDHPHHVGLWFNYGNVDGYDFWNNSDAIEPTNRSKMGTIVHRAVTAAKGGPEEGVLDTDSDWVAADGTVLLKEHTKYVFRGTTTTRTIDRITALTAGTKRVPLPDNKEGVLGLRVARWLEQPSKSADVFLDANLKPAAKAVNNDGVTGNYIGSDGKTGDAVWSTRGPWTMLQGTTSGEAVTIAMLDHPDNPGFPTYWHARGYGLFAANNLGQKVFDPKQEEAKRTIAPGASMTFRHRVMIIDGTPDAAQMTAEQKKFAAQK